MAEKKQLKSRTELVEKYFDGSQVYEEGNMGLVSLLSDLQHMYTSRFDEQSAYWNTILNDIKSILIEDGKIKKKSDIKSIEERINDNIKYQTTAEHLKDKPLEQIKKQAEIIGIVGYISEYIQWDPNKAIDIANDLLEDVNLHKHKVINLNGFENKYEKKKFPIEDLALDKLMGKSQSINCPNCRKADMEYVGLLSTDLGDNSHLSYKCKCNCIVNLPYLGGSIEQNGT